MQQSTARVVVKFSCFLVHFYPSAQLALVVMISAKWQLLAVLENNWFGNCAGTVGCLFLLLCVASCAPAANRVLMPCMLPKTNL